MENTPLQETFQSNLAELATVSLDLGDEEDALNISKAIFKQYVGRETYDPESLDALITVRFFTEMWMINKQIIMIY